VRIGEGIVECGFKIGFVVHRFGGVRFFASLRMTGGICDLREIVKKGRMG